MGIITLDQAKRQLGIEPRDRSDDLELQAYVDAITPVVEDYKHEVIEPRAITEELELPCRGRPGCQRFRIWSVPVMSLTSVVSWDGSFTWDVTQMRVSPSGIVRVMAGPPVTGLVDVTYQAGQDPVPDRYVRGGLIILAHVWETQRGQGTVMSGVIGQEEHFRQPGEWFTIPNKSKEWLGIPRPTVG